MSYKDKYGSTVIYKTKYKTFSVGWDQDDANGPKFVNFYYCPYEPNFHHEHIDMTRKQAIILRDWLNEFLEDTK